MGRVMRPSAGISLTGCLLGRREAFFLQVEQWGGVKKKSAKEINNHKVLRREKAAWGCTADRDLQLPRLDGQERSVQL